MQVFCINFSKLIIRYFQAFETFTYRCSKEILPFLNSINDIISDFVAYDPNYQYDECDDADSMELNGSNMETDGII